MFHAFTIVHLSLLGSFALLGLKGLSVYRNKRVSMRVSAGGRQLMGFTYSDVVLLFAALSVISLDSTSLEFILWTVDQLKHGPKVASVIVFSAYATALVCALGYAFGGAVVVFVNLAGSLVARTRGQ